jgi:hypothetical protein
MLTPETVFGARIGSVFRGWMNKIHEINKKYEKPRITMSPGVKLALLLLRLYLVLLVVLLGYKFWTMMK